ncbi:helix-turn-helix transcriptional regulator [Niveibacterium sp. SC-1]|uniref:helix-turn-helix transcriptional regulator n=1 Tax=Niveibacterium sp. SC-1 TaxID=3135646 RepID=UPI00311D6578
MRRSKSPRVTAYIRQICSLGLPDTQVMPELVEALREMVGADKGMFFWAGADCEIAALYAQNEAVYRTLDAFAALSGSGHIRALMGDFADWMRGRAHFSNSAHIDRIFTASAFFGEVMVPCHCRHLMVSVVRDAKRGRGCFMMTREPGRKPFDDAEHALLDSFGAHVLHALQPPRHDPDYREPALDAMLLLDWQGRILERSASGDHLLRLAHDQARGGAPVPVLDRLPPALQPLLARLQATQEHRFALPSRIETQNRWGRFRWRLYPLQERGGSAPLILHLDLQRAATLTLARGAHRLGLSVRQQAVGLRWAAGQTQRQIGAELGIKDSTVIDHLRRIYDRLDVRDHAALASRLRSAGAHAPDDGGFSPGRRAGSRACAADG